jgi:redox-sensing transcriptional repressor
LTAPRGLAIVGCGRLGTTLALHVPLANYGMNLVAAFDTDPRIVGTNLGPVRIDHADRIPEICADRRVELAALSVPKEAAQATTDLLVMARVRGMLNFTRVRLRVPAQVVVQNRQMVCSFIQLSYSTFSRRSSAPTD